MPCACIIPLPDVPSVNQWGPVLWKILHALAEKYGTLVSPLFEAEEAVSWLHIINSTGTILPCKDCRDHYDAWLKNNPPQFKNKTSSEKRTWVRNYFWSLHTDINLRNGKENVDFDYLSTLYKSVDIVHNLRIYEKFLETFVQHNEISILKWKSWYSSVRKLLSIYS